jgi:hypothetical protein
MYGLAAAVIALLVHLAIMRATGSSVVFAATLSAALLPSHVALAVLIAFAGAITIVVTWAARCLERRAIVRPTGTGVQLLSAAVAMWTITFVHGTLTGHGVLGSGTSTLTQPFNGVWRTALVGVAAGSLGLLAIPAGALVLRSTHPTMATLCFAAALTVGGGALAWGLRLGEFTMFHAFFGPLVLVGTPVAVAAVMALWDRLRARGRQRIALVLITAAVLQVELGVGSSLARLMDFSPHAYPPVPVAVLDTISALEPDAKLAYACNPGEEIAYWDPRLLSIDLHTGRRIIPLCHQTNALGVIVGGEAVRWETVPSFVYAPQSQLFPTRSARPPPEEVTAFMEREGIGYLYVDAVHPNTLVPEAVPVLVVGETMLLQLP